MLGEKPYLPGNAPCAKVLGMIAEMFEMFMCTCAAVRFVHAAELELQFSSSPVLSSRTGTLQSLCQHCTATLEGWGTSLGQPDPRDSQPCLAVLCRTGICQLQAGLVEHCVNAFVLLLVTQLACSGLILICHCTLPCSNEEILSVCLVSQSHCKTLPFSA